MHTNADLLKIYQAALAKVEGRTAVSTWLDANRVDHEVRLIAIGKAAQSMAMGAHDQLGSQIRHGLIISKQGHLNAKFCRDLKWEAIEAAHPVPDASSLYAGERLISNLCDDDNLALLVLISGGASSLVERPVEGVDLAFLARTNEWLLGSGLDIISMNRVRKGLSLVKGGGLLAWVKQRYLQQLAVSDVPNNRPEAIGSGLLVLDAELEACLMNMPLPDWLLSKLKRGLDQRASLGWVATSPKLHIVADLEMAKAAAVRTAWALGYPSRLKKTFLQGDACEVGRVVAQQLLEGPRGVTVWGGETTVNLPEHPGQGGRNQHLALAAAEVLLGSKGCLLLAAGTDGTDGPTDDAGAMVDGGTLLRAQQEGIDAKKALARADSGRLLEASGDLITTGPTGTNVMDLVIGLKE
jgi:hydroxypyruvate reductase